MPDRVAGVGGTKPLFSPLFLSICVPPKPTSCCPWKPTWPSCEARESSPARRTTHHGQAFPRYLGLPALLLFTRVFLPSSPLTSPQRTPKHTLLPTAWTSPRNACTATHPAHGGAFTAGTVVIADRGGCNFTNKVCFSRPAPCVLPPAPFPPTQSTMTPFHTLQVLEVVSAGVSPAALLIVDVEGRGLVREDTNPVKSSCLVWLVCSASHNYPPPSTQVPPLLDASVLPEVHFPVIVVEQSSIFDLDVRSGSRLAPVHPYRCFHLQQRLGTCNRLSRCLSARPIPLPSLLRFPSPGCGWSRAPRPASTQTRSSSF